MSGVSGTSETGVTHRYYPCHMAKRYKKCDKKRVAKDFNETAVTDTALRLLNDAPIPNCIVDNCFEVQLNTNASLPALEVQLKQVQKVIDNVMNAIKQGIITPTTKAALEGLERDRETLELSVAKEKIERPVISKGQIMFWLSRFSAIDLNNTEQKQKLIDAFVNSVYVYDNNTNLR